MPLSNVHTCAAFIQCSLWFCWQNKVDLRFLHTGDLQQNIQTAKRQIRLGSNRVHYRHTSLIVQNIVLCSYGWVLSRNSHGFVTFVSQYCIRVVLLGTPYTTVSVICGVYTNFRLLYCPTYPCPWYLTKPQFSRHIYKIGDGHTGILCWLGLVGY